MKKDSRLDTVTEKFYELDFLTELYIQLPEVVLEWIEEMELPFTEEELRTNIPNIEFVQHEGDALEELIGKKK